MKTNTFILIVSAYSVILAFPALFFPDFSLEYFGTHPGVLASVAGVPTRHCAKATQVSDY